MGAFCLHGWSICIVRLTWDHPSETHRPFRCSDGPPPQTIHMEQKKKHRKHCRNLRDSRLHSALLSPLLTASPIMQTGDPSTYIGASSSASFLPSSISFICSSLGSRQTGAVGAAVFKEPSWLLIIWSTWKCKAEGSTPSKLSWLMFWYVLHRNSSFHLACACYSCYSCCAVCFAAFFPMRERWKMSQKWCICCVYDGLVA